MSNLPGQWLYLRGRTTATHYVLPGDAGAACGIWISPAFSWMGTGSQEEYEEAARRPRCHNCSRNIGLLP